jgi:hypothetical protein
MEYLTTCLYFGNAGFMDFIHRPEFKFELFRIPGGEPRDCERFTPSSEPIRFCFSLVAHVMFRIPDEEQNLETQ